MINSNLTNVWTHGPINDLNLNAMDDPNVGLEACVRYPFGTVHPLAAAN